MLKPKVLFCRSDDLVKHAHLRALCGGGGGNTVIARSGEVACGMRGGVVRAGAFANPSQMIQPEPHLRRILTKPPYRRPNRAMNDAGTDSIVNPAKRHVIGVSIAALARM
jgi:hypothetical protein